MLEGGYHLLLDLEGCNPRLLDSPAAMAALCRRTAEISGARILKEASHRFQPQGVTAFAIIAESHVSVHTWPQSRRAFIDLFTCREVFDADRVIEHVRHFLGSKRGAITLLLRDGMATRLRFRGFTPVAAHKFDFGRVIFSLKSRFQHIELTTGSMGLSMFLNGYWQFVEKYERIYHEALVHPAMVCARRLERVAIGGGGDGLALREVLRYPQLGRAWLYEIDPSVLELARTHPEMRRLNGGSLDHPKACVVADDAKKMLVPWAGFDVLLLDFPSVSDGTEFSELYSESFYRRAKRSLASNGILVTQVTDYLSSLLRTTRNLMKLFRYVFPIDIGRDYSMFNFVMASDLPLRPRRALPNKLSFMTAEKVKELLHPVRLDRGFGAEIPEAARGESEPRDMRGVYRRHGR